MVIERSLLREGAASVGGMDEVGRGSWAGPVVVGIVVIDTVATRPPRGIRDSKALSANRRTELVPAIARWCKEWSIGSASPSEIDEHGLTRALHLAARRALRKLSSPPDAIILDGDFDYVAMRPALWSVSDDEVGATGTTVSPEVTLGIGADATSVTVAAASIVAKVARDDEMRRLAMLAPAYRFDDNKGYGTPAHRAAVHASGLSEHHRGTWRFARGQVAPQGVCAGEASPPRA